MSVALIVGGHEHPVTRSGPMASWRADVACPVCGLSPVRVRGYPDEETLTAEGRRAPAWCAGRHAEPIGVLVERVDAHTLYDPAGQPETFRARIYNGGAK